MSLGLIVKNDVGDGFGGTPILLGRVWPGLIGHMLSNNKILAPDACGHVLYAKEDTPSLNVSEEDNSLSLSLVWISSS